MYICCSRSAKKPAVAFHLHSYFFDWLIMVVISQGCIVIQFNFFTVVIFTEKVLETSVLILEKIISPRMFRRYRLPNNRKKRSRMLTRFSYHQNPKRLNMTKTKLETYYLSNSFSHLVFSTKI